MSPARYWQDIAIGETFATENISLSRQDILEFATEFDPQPYHLDSEAADNSIFGGLCASGWHVCALMMRLLTDTFARDKVELLGSSGVSNLRWRKPVFAGDTLHGNIRVRDHSESAGDDRYGYIECEVEVVNQDGDAVVFLTTQLLIGRLEEVTHV